MKNANLILGLIAVFSLSVIFSSCETRDPVDYNDEVLGYYSELDEQIADYATALWDESYSLDELQDEYDKTVQIYENNYDLLTEIKPMDKDPGFHKSVIDFYEGVKDKLDNEYKQIMDYYNADEWEDSYTDKIYELDEQAFDALIEMENDVIDAQQEFADEYDITLM